MKISGSIVKVVANGYERTVTMNVDGNDLVFSNIDYNNYIDGCLELPISEINKDLIVHLKIIMGTIDNSSYDTSEGFVQPTAQSPHTNITGILKKVCNDVLTISIQKHGYIDVDFEDNVNLNIEEIISIKGELTSQDNFWSL